MTVFRWIIGVLSLLFAAGSALSFGFFVGIDASVWLERARRFRHWTWLTLLLWFNVEIWRSVVLVIVRW
jgi:hypothetical protein